MITTLMSPDFLQRFAGSLLHFVWQGALIAMVTAIALRLLAARSAESRYTVSVAALFLMLAAPVVTFMFYAQTGMVALKVLQFISESMKSAAPSAALAAATTAWTQWIVLAWVAGVLICSIRLIAGWRMSSSLTKVGTSAVPSEIQIGFNEIMERLAVTTPVRLLASLRIDTPVAVGWLRPAVLLPITAISGLDELQLRAVFAHELAHIRRHDFLVNLLQRGVESVLFYHPAVWWLSSRIRSEREHCCDDLAVQVCGDRSAYAQALIELEQVRTVNPDLAVAATGGILTQRIHRVLGYRIANYDWQSAIAALLFVVVWVTVGAWQSNSTLDAKSLAPIPVPVQAPIVVNSAAVNAIAAIVTAQPVQPVEPTQAVQAAPPDAVGTGVIEGILRDDFGNPAPGARVLAVAVPTGTGVALSPEMIFLRQEDARTDTEGRYRLEKIPVGAYYILAGRIGFPTFYPGTPDANVGKVVTVTAGATTSNINFALTSMSIGIKNPPRPQTPFPQTLPGILTLYVSVKVEGEGKIPIFADGRFPRLKLTRVDTNTRYEMGLGGVAIAVPRNNTTLANEYKVSVEDLPAGYTVKSITYRADESGLRLEDVLHGTLKISSRANDSASAGSPDATGAPDLPIAITLTAPTRFPTGTIVSGTSEGMIVVPKIPPVGGGISRDEFFSLSSGNPVDAGIYISGKPGVLFSDGSFQFSGVSAGLHRIVLYTMTTDGPRVAAADVMVPDSGTNRTISDVPLQFVSVLPKNIFSPPVLSAGNAGPVVVALPSLTVRVLDEATQQPIASGYATLTGITPSIRRYIGTSGLLMPRVLPGEYTLTAESSGYITKTQTVTVGYSELSVDIKITRSPR